YLTCDKVNNLTQPILLKAGAIAEYRKQSFGSCDPGGFDRGRFFPSFRLFIRALATSTQLPNKPLRTLFSSCLAFSLPFCSNFLTIFFCSHFNALSPNL